MTNSSDVTLAPTSEADELARRISMDQAHAHAERHVQQAVNNLVHWATQMVESNDRGEVVTGEVRDNLLTALRETQALSLTQTPEAVAWWIGRYLERKTVQLDLAIPHERDAPTHEQEQPNGPEVRQDVSAGEGRSITS